MSIWEGWFSRLYVMPFMDMYDLWDGRYYDVKLYNDVVLEWRVIMVEWSPFGENEISYGYVQWVEN